MIKNDIKLHYSELHLAYLIINENPIGIYWKKI